MKRKIYETTADYIKSVELVKAFVNDELGGDIDKLRTLCLQDNTKYIGAINDPDMYLIVQAIYIILWGDIYDLTFENMGTWDENGTYPFRGDTMNSFASIFGKEKDGKEFGYRAKLFGADKNPELWSKIEQFFEMYHWIGNFIVIPNRSRAKYGINGARGSYYDNEKCEGMRDYFDWFLLKLAEYQNKVKSKNTDFSKFERLLQKNPEYSPEFLEISEWKERFFLEHYYQDEKPALLFNTPLERRLLITDVPEKRQDNTYYQEEEYLKLMEDYLQKAMDVIVYRTNRMVDILKDKISKSQKNDSELKKKVVC